MSRQSVRFQILTVALALLLIGGYLRYRALRLVPPFGPGVQGDARRSTSSPAASTAQEPESPEVPPNPDACLMGEVLVRVITTDQHPIVGASVYPYLQSGLLEQEE